MEECDKTFLKVISGSFICITIAIFILFAFCVRKENIEIQMRGIKLYEQGKYVEAINEFEKLDTSRYDCRDYGDVDYYYGRCLEELSKLQQKIMTCPNCGYVLEYKEK